MSLTTLSMFFGGTPLSIALSIVGLAAFLWLLYKAVELLIEI